MLWDYHHLGNEPLIVEKHKYISFITRIILHMELKEFTATFKMSVLLTAIVNSHECFFICKFKTECPQLLNNCIIVLMSVAKTKYYSYCKKVSDICVIRIFRAEVFCVCEILHKTHKIQPIRESLHAMQSIISFFQSIYEWWISYNKAFKQNCLSILNDTK